MSPDLPPVGAKVLLCGSHPHSGKVGGDLAHHELALLGGRAGARVRLDNGSACYVMDAADCALLDEQGRPVGRGRRR